MRLADQADDLYRDYLRLAEYREHVSSAKPSVTGYVSDCCRAETRERFGKLLCINCGRYCSMRSWHSPLNSCKSRGGWDPSKREQVMFVNETITRNTRAEDDRHARGADLIRELADLIEPCPRSMSRAAWKRSLLGWKRRLGERTFADVARKSVDLGHSALLWTESSVHAWVREARAIVNERAARAGRAKRRGRYAREQGAA